LYSNTVELMLAEESFIKNGYIKIAALIDNKRSYNSFLLLRLLQEGQDMHCLYQLYQRYYNKNRLKKITAQHCCRAD
jgi:hypothetical protein